MGSRGSFSWLALARDQSVGLLPIQS